MEQFSLEKYLENTSRKVVTRRGNPVRIICTDRKHGEDESPVVFLEEIKGGEMLLTCKSDGRSDNNYDTQYDLFFADNDGLTEFEKAISEFIQKLTFNGNVLPSKDIKGYAKSLLDLARKELMSEISDFEIYDKGFKKGKKYALKDLPKWKKVPQDISRKELLDMMHKHIVLAFNDCANYYYIDECDLRKLPKEE